MPYLLIALIIPKIIKIEINDVIIGLLYRAQSNPLFMWCFDVLLYFSIFFIPFEIKIITPNTTKCTVSVIALRR